MEKVTGECLRFLDSMYVRGENTNIFYENLEAEQVLSAPNWVKDVLLLEKGEQERLARHAAALLLAYARRMSPYAYFSREAQKELASLFLSSLPALAKTEEGPHELLRDVRVFLIKNNPFLLAENPPDQKFLRETPYAAYSPEWILHVLNIENPQALMQPVLDVGCGKEALLPALLRAKGLDAYGIDYDLAEKGQESYLRQADWLAFPFPANSFGTIISHHAFASHFLHNHTRLDGQYEQYARVYMRILSALKPGGSFYYTPALPFIEDLLDNALYQVTREQVTGGLDIERTVVKRIG